MRAFVMLWIVAFGTGFAVSDDSRDGSPGGRAVGVGLPKDPCALLTITEIQGLAAGAQVRPGVATTNTAPLTVSCVFSWGPRTPEYGEATVTIRVIDAAKGWPRLSPDQVRQAVLRNAKRPGGSAIAGLDAGVFTVNAENHNASAEAYVEAKGADLSIEFHGGNAPARKDAVIGLLKIAIARL